MAVYYKVKENGRWVGKKFPNQSFETTNGVKTDVYTLRGFISVSYQEYAQLVLADYEYGIIKQMIDKCKGMTIDDFRSVYHEFFLSVPKIFASKDVPMVVALKEKLTVDECISRLNGYLKIEDEEPTELTRPQLMQKAKALVDSGAIKLEKPLNSYTADELKELLK